MIQESEIPQNYPKDQLCMKSYSVEIEISASKKKVCTYIKNEISYVRRNDLEGFGNHLVVVDISSKCKYRLVNLYRAFSSTGTTTPLENFKRQL